MVVTKFRQSYFCQIFPKRAGEDGAKAVGVPAGQGFVLHADSGPGFARKGAVVWYGTSILQGGVAERVGNIFTHKIARRINRTVFNFGFSGNGKMTIGVAKHLAQRNPSSACAHSRDQCGRKRKEEGERAGGEGLA